ncbi:hypothetical protein [Nitrospira sp. BLG_1]|uniref:hypothetical protein n=1 Tax=Nitrospira sp. BLG_1 TaxID=3395883 RepID=UPI0039BD8C7B
MKTKTTTETEETKPSLALQARVLCHDRDGQIRDVTDQKPFGLKWFAENGDLALYILGNCKKRLDLLFMAAENRSHIDAGIVRLIVDELRSEFDGGSELATYVRLTHELFSNSDPIAPLQMPGTRRANRATSLTAAHEV